MIQHASVRRSLGPCMIALSLATAAPGARADEIQVTAGLKTWVTGWTTWGIAQSQYSDSSYETVTPLNSDTQAALIPQMSARYERWLVSASYMTTTRYALSAAFPANYFGHLQENRSEVDANIGYYLMPGLAVTVGYKQLDQNAAGSLTWKGPTVGLAGTVPLGSRGLAAYGTLGYGLFHLDAPGLPDAQGRTGFSATYLLAELGLACSFLEHYTVTLGYRTQTARATGYSLSVINVASGVPAHPYASTELRDLTQGFTMGVSASF